MPSSDYTVTAQYQSVEYTFVIKYVNLTNGKNPSKDSNTVTAKVRDTSKAFSLTKPSVDSLIFIGWGIGENAEAVQIDAGESTFTLSLNTQGAIRNGNTITITLRAIWADSSPTFRLLFKYPQCNDLTSTPISVLESGALESGTSYTFVIPVTVPKRQSLWRFLGWMRTADTFTGSDLLNPGDEVIVTRSGTSSDIKGELTLYAHWFRFKYDLSYDLRGGTLDAIKGYTEYSTLSGVRSVMVPRETPYDPTRTFVGWKDEDGVSVNAGSTIALSPAKMTENLSSGAEEFYTSVSTELIDKNNWIISQNGNPEKKVLTAQYEGEKAVLSFNLRGGSAPSDDETLYKDMIAERTGTASNHTFAIPSAIPVKKAYAFVTWSTSPTEKIASSTVSIYAPGANVVVPYGQYLELYAHWAYAPAASWGPEISYNLEKAIPIIVDTCAVDNGVVSSVGVEKVISLEPPEVVPNGVGATRDRFTVASSPTYSITLFLRDRQSGQSMTVTPVNGTGWYFARKVYPMEEGQSPTLELHILRSSVANTMDEENKIYLTDYVMRVVTEDSDGNQYNAYHSFIIAPAGKSDDPILTGPECTLSTYMTEGAEESRIFIEGITGFSKNYDVSLMEFPILTRKVEDRYIIDMGTVESYSLSFTRANPQITDNASSDSRKWTNAQWITQFRGFLNFWQNLSYARVDGEYRRTGGFRLTYIPPDISLFPIIEKNVFVKGNVDFDYTVGRVKGNLTLIAANMQMEKVKKPAVIEIYFCRTKRDAEYKVVAFTYVAYQGIPWTIPSFPSDFSPDCVYWTDSNGNRYYPGNDVETDILSNRYLYAVELEVIGTEVRDVSGLHTLSIPDDARVVKAIIVGGGGAGDHGNANIAVMLGNWMSAFVLDFTSGAGGGSGEARYVSFTVSPTMNKVLNIYVGAGGDKDSSDKRDGELSYVEYSSLRLSASGGKAASVGKGGTLYYKGGDGYFKGGWLSIDNFDGMNDIATSHGQTNKVSPKGIPGKSNQFGSGGGAAALEAGVGMSTVTSVGGYWDGKSRKDPRYGGGGAGGGFYCTAPDVRANESGSGASGYVLVAYYNDVVKE
jgi:hypothetical protein